MRRLLATGLALFLALTAAAAADDEPRALVERAVKAAGGGEALAQRPAALVRFKGKLFEGGAPAADAPTVVGESWADSSGERAKVSVRLTAGITTLEMTHALAGGKGWKKEMDKVSALAGDELDELRGSAYRERVTSLLPLLNDSAFTLAPLGEARADDRPAAGVKVSAKGRPDVGLYFDKETGLLVKYTYRDKPKGPPHEVVLADYRPWDPAAADEAVLREAKVGTGPADLAAFLRKQAPDPAAVDKAKALVRDLRSDDFDTREKAAAGLPKLGPAAVGPLREAARDKDAEVAQRAADALQQIGAQAEPAVVAAAARLAGLRRPEGAAELLLGLAAAGDETAAQAAREGLHQLTQGGAPPEALAKAADDKDPARREAARAALGKDDGAWLKRPGRRVYPAGVKYPMRSTVSADGKKEYEVEVTAVEFFNAFDDKTFAKP
jgi:hypothetical protein